MCVCVCVCVCARACVRACVRATIFGQKLLCIDVFFVLLLAYFSVSVWFDFSETETSRWVMCSKVAKYHLQGYIIVTFVIIIVVVIIFVIILHPYLYIRHQ